MKTGLTFVDELKAAGIDPTTMPLVWNTLTGELLTPELLSPQQRKSWDDVLKRHDPSKLDAETQRRKALYDDPGVQGVLHLLQRSSEEIARGADAPEVVAAILKLLALMPLPLPPGP